MKVKILVDAAYSDFKPGGKVGAKNLKSGDVVDFPQVYAESLVKSELAEKVSGGETDLDKTLEKGRRGAKSVRSR